MKINFNIIEIIKNNILKNKIIGKYYKNNFYEHIKKYNLNDIYN
jgi:hypothetical protein